MRVKQTLSSWIREVLTDTEKEGPVKLIALCHMLSGGRDVELDSVKFGYKQWNPDELGKRFQGKAESYSQDLQGVQRFCLMAFFSHKGEGSDEMITDEEPKARHPFAISSVSYEDGGLDSEGPTPTGLVQQSMRHSEAAVQMGMRMMSVAFDNMAGMQRMLVEENRALRQENAEAINIIKAVILDKAANDKAAVIQQLQFQRDTEERKQWMHLIAPLANTILGHEIFPQGMVDVSLVEGIVESLSPDDIKMLAAKIPPEKWGPFAQRAQKLLESKRIEEAEVKQIAAGQDPVKELE